MLIDLPGIAKLEPIAGVAGIRPEVFITLLNLKEGFTNWKCMFIPYGPGWNDAYKIFGANRTLPTSIDEETKQLNCKVNKTLTLEDGAPWAQVSSLVRIVVFLSDAMRE